MESFKFLKKEAVKRLPKSPGVYAFKKGTKRGARLRREGGGVGVLYIGKASDIRERVKNHFQQPAYRDNLFINLVKKVGYLETNSEIEALLLEANLIKKYQPKYNVVWRDDKNYFFIGITKEDFPRVFVTHQTRSEIGNWELGIDYIGPFVEGRALKKTLRFLRKVFPYYTTKKHPKVPCPYCHLSLCPGPNPDLKEYRKNIRNLIKVLKGKRQSVLKNLKKEMQKASDQKGFERAAKIRDQIKALESVMANVRIIEVPREIKENWTKTQKILKKIIKREEDISRIEAYDVSNIRGKDAAGAMVTFLNGQPEKNFYRKFRIKISGKPNDIAMLKECLIRRFKHLEWGRPDLILIDGGKAQLNVARQYLKWRFEQVGVIALAKKKNELFIGGQKKPILLKALPREIFNLILQLRDEAHRFAITYHKKLRKIDLISKF
jgi:excinuclease ABC subunit C